MESNSASNTISNTRERFYLGALIILAFLVRLYGITLPITDGGQERQTFVAMIARNLLRDGMNVLYPRIDIFGMDPGYVFYEFPLQPLLMALAYKVFGIHDVIGRLSAVIFSIASIPFMYGIAKYLLGFRGALAATTIYAFTPLSIFIGRAVFPEAPFLFFALGALYFTIIWSDTGRLSHLLLSFSFGAVCFLIKPPPGLVLLLPFFTLWWLRYKNLVFKKPAFYLYFALIMIPITFWALWGHSLGKTNSLWNPYQLAAIEMWGVPDYWFKFHFYAHTIKSTVVVALTPLVALAAIYGLMRIKHNQHKLFILSWVFANLAYVFLTPLAQCNHWHYQVPLIPLGAILAVFGFQELTRLGKIDRLKVFYKNNQSSSIFFALLVFACHIFLYYQVVRLAYDPMKRMPSVFEVAQIVQREFTQDGFLLLVEPHMVPVGQSYYMDRKILQIPEDHSSEILAIDEVNKWILKGAKGLVAVDTPYGKGTQLIRQDRALKDFLNLKFRTVSEADNYIILALR